jgi:glutamyl-tRNA reductase
MAEVVAQAGESRKQRLVEVAEARVLVDDALVSLRRRMVKNTLGSLSAAIQRRYQETARKGLERMFRRELAGLGEAERAALTRWAETLARRFAHVPTEGLKGLAFDVGLGGVEAFLNHADKALLDELDLPAGRRLDLEENGG